MSAITTAVSGLYAQQTRLGVSASNIANAQSANYTPKQATLTPSGAGVSATVSDKPNATAQTYSPQSPLADGSGLVMMPDISIEEEIINMMTAEIAYKANISTLKTAQDMEESLLSVLT